MFLSFSFVLAFVVMSRGDVNALDIAVTLFFKNPAKPVDGFAPFCLRIVGILFCLFFIAI